MRLYKHRLQVTRRQLALAALAFFLVGLAAGLEAIHLAGG